AKKLTSDVNTRLYAKMIKPVRCRFFTFGCSTSRYTCASDSSPLMARIECPKPMRIATAVNAGQIVPFNQPNASFENRRLPGTGDGGNGTPAGLKWVSAN